MANMKNFLAGMFLSAGLAAAVPASTATTTFTPFTCPSSAFMIQGTTLYSMDLPSSNFTQIEAGFGFTTSVALNCLGYNVQDNYLYATTDASAVVRLSASNQYQTVVSIAAPMAGGIWSAGDVDDNNQFWLFAGNSQYTQIDTSLNQVVGGAAITAPMTVNDWSFLSGGGRALWSVNVANGGIILARFDMASKVWTTAQTYSLLTGNSGSNFNAMFAYSATVLEALDATTNQVWRFDITGATAPVQGPSYVGAIVSRDNARCINGGVSSSSSTTTTSSLSSSLAPTIRSTTTSSSITSPTVTAKYDGCYTDLYPSSRALNDFPRLVSSVMTPLLCQQYCSQYGANLFGVEYSSECYCGNSILGGATAAPASDCSFPCSGDGTQMCGGNNRLNIYGILPATSSSSTSRSTSSTTTTSASSKVTAQVAGCYTDPYLATSRTLGDFPRLVSSSMTPAVCQQYCAQYTASLFGVEFGTECYCGNSIQGGAVSAPAADCSYTCAGDSTQNCGGSARIFVYGSVASVTSTSSARSIATTSAGPSVTAVSDGCYTDSYPIGRTLNDFPRLISNSMTPYVCQQYCAQYGAALFGVEYNSECYCGNSLLGGAVPAPASDCSYACSGDASQMCGGSNRLNIYGVLPAISSTTTSSLSSSTSSVSSTTTARPSVTAVSNGCYTDSYPTGRTLNDFPRLISNSMTPYVCQQYCAQFSAALFGVEYNSECYCGNSLLGVAVPAPASDCNYACSGDASQMCGGSNRLNIYGVIPAASRTATISSSTRTYTSSTTSSAFSTVPKPTARANGCFVDIYPNGRVLGDYPRFTSSSMTPYVCQQYCAQYNSNYFGVEYSTECYCGNSIAGAMAAPVSDCNFACSGDATQTCGGNNRLNIYSNGATSGTISLLATTTSRISTSASSSITTTTSPMITTTSAISVMTTTTSSSVITTSTSSAPATSSSSATFTPFTCPSTPFVSDGQTLYSMDPATSSFTQVETGFGLQSSSASVNAMGYNVRDNFLYSVTNGNVIIRMSANNMFQTVATIPAPPSGVWSAGDVDGNNQLWLFSGNSQANSQWMQVDTSLNSIIATGSTSSPAFVNDWVYLSGGGSALWSVSIVNGVVAVLRFDMNSKVVSTPIAYSLLTGNTATNFNAMFAISPTVFEALDATTFQVWRFDVTNATAPTQQPSSQPSTANRDGARCITNLR